MYETWFEDRLQVIIEKFDDLQYILDMNSETLAEYEQGMRVLNKDCMKLMDALYMGWWGDEEAAWYEANRRKG